MLTFKIISLAECLNIGILLIPYPTFSLIRLIPGPSMQDKGKSNVNKKQNTEIVLFSDLLHNFHIFTGIRCGDFPFCIKSRAPFNIVEFPYFPGHFLLYVYFDSYFGQYKNTENKIILWKFTFLLTGQFIKLGRNFDYFL